MTKSICKSPQLILLFLLTLCFKLQAQEISIHISPFGDDQYEGTKERPVANINENMNNNTVIHNIFLECENTTIRQPKVVILENNLETDKNPGFEDPENEKYFMHKIPESLKKIKFKPIPFEKIGLKKIY